MRRNLGRRRVSEEEGWTLTETLAALAIGGMLAAAVLPNLVGLLGRSRSKTAQLQVETVATAVEMFRSDVGRYPSQSEGLQVLMSAPADTTGWTGPYVKNERQLSDPWGNRLDYRLSTDGRSFQVVSFGADGQANGDGQNRDLVAPAGQ